MKMNNGKKSVLVLLILIIVFSAGGCSLTNDLKGDDYITYYNSDRAGIVGDYVGSKVKNSKDLLNDILVSAELYSGSLYSVSVENNNAEYFFNGTITVTVSGETVKVNVWMLAPGCAESCLIKIEDVDGAQAQTKLSGNFYEYNPPAWEMICKYTIAYDGSNAKMVCDTEEISETLLKQVADLAYANETLRNSLTRSYYYLYTNTSTGDADYAYYLYVNETERNVIIYDKAGTVVKEYNY